MKIKFKPDNQRENKLIGFDWDNGVLYTMLKEDSPTANGGFLDVKVVSENQRGKWLIKECKPISPVSTSIKDMKLSSYQEKIMDFVLNEKGNAVINAVAGSGKTTTLLQIIKRINRKEKGIYLAFNKSIEQEMKAKIPAPYSNIGVKTCHAIGYHILKSSIWNNKKPEVNNRKYTDIVNNQCIKWEIECENSEIKSKLYEVKRAIKKLLGMAMMTLTDFHDEEELINLAAKFDIKWDIDSCPNFFHYMRDVAAAGLSNFKIVSYTDMVYMTYYYQDRVDFPVYDWVLIDECQDLNAIQQYIFKKIVKPETGRFIAVGDKFQAIYAFTGADIKSFDKIMESDNTTELKLSVTYRCAKKIVETAKEIIPEADIIPFEDAPEGYVYYDSYESAAEGDMVLAATNISLIKLLLFYVNTQKKKAMIIGRDFADELYNMLDFAEGKSIKKKLDSLDKDFENFRQKRIEQIGEEAADTDSALDTYDDKITCLRFILEGKIANNAKLSTQMKKAKSLINEIFKPEDEECIRLSTAHKAKGLENEKVFLVDDGLINQRERKLDWQQEQERNLIYVAHTRAKTELVYIVDFNPYVNKD